MKFPDHVTVDMSALKTGWSDITIDVRYSRPLKLRLWLAVKLTHVVAWLAGGKAREVEE